MAANSLTPWADLILSNSENFSCQRQFPLSAPDHENVDNEQSTEPWPNPATDHIAEGHGDDKVHSQPFHEDSMSRDLMAEPITTGAGFKKAFWKSSRFNTSSNSVSDQNKGVANTDSLEEKTQDSFPQNDFDASFSDLADTHDYIYPLEDSWAEQPNTGFAFRAEKSKQKLVDGEEHGWTIGGAQSSSATTRSAAEWVESTSHTSDFESHILTEEVHQAQQKRTNRTWFTHAIALVFTTMMLVELGLSGWRFAPLNINPLIGPSSEQLIDLGARQTSLILEEGQWFRIVTPIFLHAGIVHYLTNMLAFWFIGGAIEEAHGIVTAIVLFFIPGVGGNILGATFLPQYISVGASGGTFGMIGGYFADIVLNWNILCSRDHDEDVLNWRKNIAAIARLAIGIIALLVLGVTPFIDNFTHLGALCYGLLCGLFAIEPVPLEGSIVRLPSRKMSDLLFRQIGAIVSVFLLVITSVVLNSMNVDDSPCHGCRYLACVPFPWWKEADERWWSCDDCPFVTAKVHNTNGDLFYDRMDLVCPNDVVEQIDITGKNLTSGDEISKLLPSYCRARCEDKFQF
jgi:membrane associated rhomboid family serine protease